MSTNTKAISDTAKRIAEQPWLTRAERDRMAGDIAKAIHDAVMAERARIVALLLEEAELTPCGEDAMVTRSNAFLIKADFSYEEAERLSEEAEG